MLFYVIRFRKSPEFLFDRQEEMQHDYKLCGENKIKPCLFKTLKSIVMKFFTDLVTYHNKSFKSRKSVSYLCLNKIKSNMALFKVLY